MIPGFEQVEARSRVSFFMNSGTTVQCAQPHSQKPQLRGFGIFFGNINVADFHPKVVGLGRDCVIKKDATSSLD
jgi:hypothetical protein